MAMTEPRLCSSLVVPRRFAKAKKAITVPARLGPGRYRQAAIPAGLQARSASYFEAVSADADSLEGKNVHFGLIDEFHAHRSRDVYDAIETGTGKRDQSMLWAITTAGSDKTGVCYDSTSQFETMLRRCEDV